MTTPPTLAEKSAAKPASLLGDLGPRVVSALAMIALALGALYQGGFVFVAFWTVAAVAVHWEWQRITGGPQERLRIYGGGLAIALSGGLMALGQRDASLLVLAVTALAIFAFARGPSRLWNAAGVLYAGALLLSVTVLRLSILSGFEAILWLFAIVWGTDIMAYFGGRLIGGPKLWPRVSPSKTWSGFLVGITSGAFLGLGALLAVSDQVQPVPVIALGLVAGAIAQGGDLFESSVKRRYGVKDSGHLIPGHGGAMDRLDGFITAALFAAVFGAIHAGAAAAAHGLFVW
jgi:phosphatidate cytidylyltransferase